jgi:hypothetical protein
MTFADRLLATVSESYLTCDPNPLHAVDRERLDVMCDGFHRHKT